MMWEVKGLKGDCKQKDEPDGKRFGSSLVGGILIIAQAGYCQTHQQRKIAAFANMRETVTDVV